MALRANGYDPNTPYIPNPKYQSPYTVDYKTMDYSSVRKSRQDMLRRLREDGGWDKLKRYYADGNVCAFIEDWLYTFDPRLASRKIPSTVPLILFPRQIEYVEALMSAYYNQDDMLVGKSRDMGVSVVTLAVMTYLWLFDPGFKGSVGSRKEDLVDKIGDTDSLLEKVRIYLRYLPPEMLPFGYSERENARRMNIVNPVTGAAIKGEGGRKMGRGGRSTMYLVDEAAFLEDPESVDAAISENTECRIDVSTPNGPANPFAMKWFYNESAIAFPFHWTQDPRKDKSWYEAKKLKLQDAKTIAQELDLDFDTSGDESTIRREWLESSIALRQWLDDNDLLPPKSYYIPVAGGDVGGGVAENTYIAVWGPIIGDLIAWVDADTTNTANRFSALSRQDGVSRFKYDSIGVGHGVASTLRRLPIVSTGVNVGTKATMTMWPDKRTARDKFMNLKAETWWILRDRFQKTHFMWQWINDPETGREYDLDELLLLSGNDPKLVDQLAAPGYKRMEGGKIKIEGKDELQRRGIASPDRAEALVIALSPFQRPAQFGQAQGLA